MASTRTTVLVALGMLLQVAVQDIGQVPYIEPGEGKPAGRVLRPPRDEGMRSRPPHGPHGSAPGNAAGGPPGTGDPPYRASLLCAEAVELTVPDATDERMPFIRCEPKHRSFGISTVANTHLAAGQVRYLNAVPVGETQRALHPFGWTYGRRHSHATPSLITVFALLIDYRRSWASPRVAVRR